MKYLSLQLCDKMHCVTKCYNNFARAVLVLVLLVATVQSISFTNDKLVLLSLQQQTQNQLLLYYDKRSRSTNKHNPLYKSSTFLLHNNNRLIKQQQQQQRQLLQSIIHNVSRGGGGDSDTVKEDIHIENSVIEEEQEINNDNNSQNQNQNQQNQQQLMMYTNNNISNMKLNDIIQQLQTSIQYGLNAELVKQKQLQYGYNILDKSKSKSLVQLIYEQLDDKLVQILLFVAIVSSIFSIIELIQNKSLSTTTNNNNNHNILHYFVEPFVIIFILLINGIIGIVQSQSATNSINALEQLQASTCCVIRNNSTSIDNSTNNDMTTSTTSTTTETIPAEMLVPGDIIIIRTGDKVPADGRIVSIQTAVFSVDEASLTGESMTVSKTVDTFSDSESDSDNDNTNNIPVNRIIQEQNNMVFAGTVVTRGTAKVVVTHTGMNTQFGTIQKSVMTAQSEQSKTKTPLTIKLNNFANDLTKIIGIICISVFIINIPKLNNKIFNTNYLIGIIYYIKVSIALGVAAIPEGLPAVITLCLSLGTIQMSKYNNVIVRTLPSIETLGCTTVICTDKTGTLTTNEMTVVSLLSFTSNSSNVGTKVTITEHTVDGYSYTPIGTISNLSESEIYSTATTNDGGGSIIDIIAVSSLSNDAKIVASTSTSTTNSNNSNSSNVVRYERVGEPTEAALCVLAEKIGTMMIDTNSNDDNDNLVDTTTTNSALTLYDNNNSNTTVVEAAATVNKWRISCPRIATLEFNRDRKSMSVLCQYTIPQLSSSYDITTATSKNKKNSKKNSNNVVKKNRLLVKGAPNLLIERCSHIKLRDGTIVKINNSIRKQLYETITAVATRPLRCIALAIKEHDTLDDTLRTLSPNTNNNNSDNNNEDTGIDMSKHTLLSNPDNYKNIESGLTLVGVVGIKDPARPGVADSIEQCTKAGIRVIMITGDSKETAIAIAKDVKIFTELSIIKAYEGREFFSLPEREQISILQSDNSIFCRVEPTDKQKLIKLLQSLNEITAMTGDGVNDAPALQQASIGIAMGITGTEVAKEASDMILTDDNFSSIVTAVHEGRRIYNNMQAVICFLISCNIGEICTIFFATLCGIPEPLSAVHLLWINLVTDGPPATALGFNPSSPGLMNVPPRPTNEPIMTKWLLIRYCITGIYVGLATIGVFVQHYMNHGISLSQLASWSQCGVDWAPSSTSASLLSGFTDASSSSSNSIDIICTNIFQGNGRKLPQTLALTTLVCIEMIKALCAVSVDTSIVHISPHKNPWLLLAVAVPLLLHIFVIYSSHFGFSSIGNSLGLVPLSKSDWINVLCWSIPILFVDEILKAIGRWIHREQRAKQKQRVAVAAAAAAEAK